MRLRARCAVLTQGKPAHDTNEPARGDLVESKEEVLEEYTVNDMEKAVGEILRDGKRLQRLLKLEKERRGVSRDALVFVGMHNVAQHWWCTQQAVLKSRANELDFFAAYLNDRILYAHRLGLVTKVPRTNGAILDVGNEITFADVEKLHQQEKENAKAKRRVVRSDEPVAWLRAMLRCEGGGYSSATLTDKSGQRGVSVWRGKNWRVKAIYDEAGVTLVLEDHYESPTTLIRPDLPEELWVKLETSCGVEPLNLEETSPMGRGQMYDLAQAELYPTIRWHFPWGRHSVGGVPDGLTEDSVYEYKTTRSRFLFSFAKPVAIGQADLYGYFFRRPKKRVQIYVVEDDVTETYEVAVDAARAEDTLTAFARVDAGEPARPPRAWKCRACDFRATCPISQAE